MCIYSVRCNHCGESFQCHIDNAAFPCCAKCMKAGHVRSAYGCPACRSQLREDLRSDALQNAIGNRQLDIGFFDND